MINPRKIKEGRYYADRSGNPILVDNIETIKNVIEITHIWLNSDPYVRGENSDFANEIFLTPEWMLKFGFSESEEKTLYSFNRPGKEYILNESFRVYKVYANWFFVIENIILPLKFVNDLQDLVFEHCGILLKTVE